MKSTAQLTDDLVAGLDVGRSWTHVCISGEDVEPAHVRLRTTTEEFQSFFSTRPFVRVVLEAGPSSPWMSRLLSQLGHNVIVVDSRQSGLKYLVSRKTDRADAEALAALALCPQLLRRVEHAPERVADDMLLLKARKLLVKIRVQLTNFVDGIATARGIRIRRGSTKAFTQRVWPTIPEDLRPTLSEIFEEIASVSAKIKRIDHRCQRVIKERYAESVGRVKQVYGVGPITSLSFVLKIFDVLRFKRARDIGAYLGLVPSVRQSGSIDPKLSISKAGDVELRRLLVQAAQTTLQNKAPDSDLKRFGLKIRAQGGKHAYSRAVTAVARRLAVLMLALWKSGEEWEPLRISSKIAVA